MNTTTRRLSPHRVLLALPLVLLIAACGGEGSSDIGEAEAAPLVLASTDVATVERGSISSGISITGNLDPYRVVEVKAQVSGTIGSVRAEEGDRVGSETVLATITAEGIRSQATASQAGVSGAEASVASAQAQLALARERAESAQFLYDEGAMSRLDLQAAQAQLEASQAQVASARSQVASARSQATGAGEQAARTTVRSPISGAVSAKQVELGEAVSPGQTLFTVVNTSELELDGRVGVAEAAQISVGDPVEFRIDAYPGQTFRGTVARIEPTADNASRQVGVFLRLPNASGLVGGLFATGTVVSQTAEDALLVPESAVRTQNAGGGETALVLVVRDSVIRQVPVAVTQRDAGRGVVAVQGQIQAGDRVIVAPTTDTVDGARVRLAGTTPGAGRL